MGKTGKKLLWQTERDRRIRFTQEQQWMLMDAVSILRAELTQPFLTQFCLWCRRWYTSADAEFVEPSDYHVVEGIGVTLNNLAREGVGLQ